nr:outer dense fiber protein 4-like [Manis javanica]
MESRTYGKQDHPPRPQSLHAGVQGSTLPIQAKTSVPHSITHSPDASRKSVESMIWTSKESFEDFEDSTQLNQNTLESSIHNLPSDSSLEVDSGRIQKIRRHRHSRLPTGWWLLQQAKKFSHQLSLILSLAGMMIIGCISLGQAWIHFQVPLTPPGDPAGPLTIPIDTILFTQCFNISCMHEYDRTAYFLDVTWIFLFVAFITSFCLSIVLINIVFFTSSNLPTLDFSNIISSILTGSSMILGVLFYLRQAHEYLQEGMTYRLGCSFYLAWTGVFLFLMTGFFSYLNYVNFWSSMMLQAV